MLENLKVIKENADKFSCIKQNNNKNFFIAKNLNIVKKQVTKTSKWKKYLNSHH